MPRPASFPARALSVGRAVSRAADVLRRIIGAPDYERYIVHVRAHHPTATPMAHDEFIRQRLADRYNKPGSRCC